jgi:hypothetical protein
MVRVCNWVPLPLEVIVVRLPSRVPMMGIQRSLHRHWFLPSFVMFVVPHTIFSLPCVVWDVLLLWTIFGFSKQNCACRFFSRKPISITTAHNPSLSKRCCIWPSHKPPTFLRHSILTCLNNLAFAFQTILTTMYGTFSTESTCTFASLSQCVLELSSLWAWVRAQLAVLVGIYHVQFSPIHSDESKSTRWLLYPLSDPDIHSAAFQSPNQDHYLTMSPTGMGYRCFHLN